MFRFQSSRRVQIDTEEVPAPAPRYDGETLADGGDGGLQLRPSGVNVTEDLEPFMGIKVRRKASRLRDYMGDYLDVQSRPYIMKILEKQGLILFLLFSFLMDLCIRLVFGECEWMQFA